MTEIRLIRPDQAGPRRGRSGDSEASAVPPPDQLSPLIRSVAGTSIEEIERIFLELKRIRDALHDEGARISRELARYANFNQSVLATMQVIRESLKPIATDGDAHS